MTALDLAAIRERAVTPVLGKPLARALDQAILDIRALLDHVDNLEAGREIERRMLRNAVTRMEAVRQLHTTLKPHGEGEHFLHPISRNPVCGECGQIAPCPTIQALDG